MRLDESVARRLRSPEFDRWMRGVSATGYCHNPVRIFTLYVVDAAGVERDDDTDRKLIQPLGDGAYLRSSHWNP